MTDTPSPTDGSRARNFLPYSAGMPAPTQQKQRPTHFTSPTPHCTNPFTPMLRPNLRHHLHNDEMLTSPTPQQRPGRTIPPPRPSAVTATPSARAPPDRSTLRRTPEQRSRDIPPLPTTPMDEPQPPRNHSTPRPTRARHDERFPPHQPPSRLQAKPPPPHHIQMATPPPSGPREDEQTPTTAKASPPCQRRPAPSKASLRDTGDATNTTGTRPRRPTQPDGDRIRHTSTTSSTPSHSLRHQHREKVDCTH